MVHGDSYKQGVENAFEFIEGGLKSLEEKGCTSMSVSEMRGFIVGIRQIALEGVEKMENGDFDDGNA